MPEIGGSVSSCVRVRSSNVGRVFVALMGEAAKADSSGLKPARNDKIADSSGLKPARNDNIADSSGLKPARSDRIKVGLNAEW